MPEVDMEEPSVPLQHQVVIVSGGGQAVSVNVLSRFFSLSNIQNCDNLLWMLANSLPHGSAIHHGGFCNG
jgi:hypothetical protein